MWSCLVLASLLASGQSPPPAAPAPAPALDPAWIGHWKGELTIVGKDRPSTVPMEIVIDPLTDRPGWQWTMIYGEGESKQVRDYALLPGAGPGRYVMDERNGILLDVSLAQGALVAVFEVQGTLLVSTEELVGDTIQHRIDAFATEGPRISTAGGAEDKTTAVRSFRATGCQRAVLRRSGSDGPPPKDAK